VCITVEYVAGGTVRTFMRRYGGRLPEDIAVHFVLRPIMSALLFMHEQVREGLGTLSRTRACLLCAARAHLGAWGPPGGGWRGRAVLWCKRGASVVASAGSRLRRCGGRTCGTWEEGAWR
jgi:hypothetical protein